MKPESSKSIRCAIYTRKSTEHGLELEFNSLDAQREACESYIKSQASQSWKVVSDRYDDPAFSGGNLDRPALKQLLKDIDAGRVDVVVVYKIDRLTRSLADFAKLVEAFDAKSISFVAVTQQFNTTTSMGRLTLNVLLSFAQFERELSSERVRDKIAASRRKGKWTGGSVPLGYDIKDKKLVINSQQAETVRYIFKRYLDLKSFSRLVADLDNKGITSRLKGIVTKPRGTKAIKSPGGIPFTYGPLAYILKSRIYVGEIGHNGKWFDGEHEAIVDRATFDAVQAQLAANRVTRKSRSNASGALLMGKLFDERGNRMSPSYSMKAGTRHRFYVCSALLRGRKKDAGTVTRIPAANIEDAIAAKLKEHLGADVEPPLSSSELFSSVDRVTIKSNALVVTLVGGDDLQSTIIEIPWSKPAKTNNHPRPEYDGEPNQKLMTALVRAHYWLRQLTSGVHSSIENLARAEKIHPKALRLGLKLAFLAPDITTAILQGDASVARMMPTDFAHLPLFWDQQRALLRS